MSPSRYSASKSSSNATRHALGSAAVVVLALLFVPTGAASAATAFEGALAVSGSACVRLAVRACEALVRSDVEGERQDGSEGYRLVRGGQAVVRDVQIESSIWARTGRRACSHDVSPPAVA
ncbi:MAG: hypothetical protein CMJ31_01020 [Phycisphaerae bacterium]|nr:hypothetical protein [Phycisphaerae bacterium]